MSRETAAVEINTFNAGLVTDASPLTSVDNSSLEEENFVLNTDGSRQRRFGMDFEEDYTSIVTSIPFTEGSSIAHASYKWENAGGVVDRNISVVQFGNEVKFFDLSSRPISGNLLHTEGFPDADSSDRFSFTNVDGFLIIVTGEKQPYIFEIDDSLNITASRQTVQIRDMFGIEDIISGTDLYSGAGLQTRPSTLPQAHRYNLRNQGWGVPRAAASGSGILGDPISRFKDADGNYPSNSDSVISALYADPTIEAGRTLERFFPSDLSKNPLGTTKAAQGYFIIDALDRGASRIAQDAANRVNYPQLSGAVTSIPTDRTPGGPSVVSEYAGRAWFGGFSGDIVGGDKLSPRMSSYVLFSKLVRSIGDITTCYQEGDPTSKEAPDVVATDGGFIRINEAYGITRMENLGDVLIIMATNGIWMVGPTSDNGFTATNFVIEKISDRGCPNPNSAVVVDNTIFYWSDDGIYHLRTDQFGAWASDSISVNRIQRLFEDITESDKLAVVGAYDSFQRKVRWIYDNDTNNERETKELILDLVLQAFYINKIFNVENGTPRVKSVFNAISYEITAFQDFVTVGGELVTADSDDVFVAREILSDVTRGELAYIVAYNSGGNLAYTFSNYTDQGFVDWRSYDGTGVDAEAFMVTSYLSGTDFQRNKQVPYITFHFRRTESGIEEIGEDLVISTPSSCIVQTMWNWANTNGSNKWGRPFQAYRYKRSYIPPTLPDTFNTGFPVLQTRHKPRGSGKVLSMKFSSEPGRDLHLYGWSMIFSVAGNV